MKTVILAAMGPNNVIGNGDLLIPPLGGDLQKFKLRTSEPDTLVVMGRTTFNGMPLIKGEILPGRSIAVLTSSVESLPSSKGRDLWGAKSSEEVMSIAIEKGYRKVWVCGGSKTYEEFLTKNLVDEMILTMHNAAYEGDKLFPIFKRENWNLVYKMPCFIGGYEVCYSNKC